MIGREISWNSCPGVEHFVTLPTDSHIVSLWEDDGDLMAETAAGEIFRIDTERDVIRAN